MHAYPRPLLEALRRLAYNDPDFKVFMEWLNVTEVETVKTLKSHRDDVVVRNAQGAAQLIDAIKGAIAAARK